MQVENANVLVTRATSTIKRSDGSSVRIVATEYDGLFNSSVGVDVFRRDNDAAAWILCSDRPHPDWRAMSVDEYKERGRSEALRAASPGEVLRVTNLIGRTRSEAELMGAHCV